MEAKLVAQHAFWMGKHGRILECKYLCVCLLCQTEIINCVRPRWIESGRYNFANKFRYALYHYCKLNLQQIYFNIWNRYTFWTFIILLIISGITSPFHFFLLLITTTTTKDKISKKIWIVFPFFFFVCFLLLLF